MCYNNHEKVGFSTEDNSTKEFIIKVTKKVQDNEIKVDNIMSQSK